MFGSIFARWRFELQAVDMGKHFCGTRPTTEIETEHLIGPFGRRTPRPQSNEQASDENHIDLQLHAVGTVAEQLAAAQDTLEPTQEEFPRPPLAIGQGTEISLQVQALGDQPHLCYDVETDT